MAASAIAPKYATDADSHSAADVLAGEAAPPSPPDGRAKRPTRAPERGGLDWSKVAEEGARFSRSGTFNTILRSILRGLTGRR